MSIGVGINENVIIKTAVVNDKKRLELELVEASKTGAVKKSVFDTLLTARTAEDSSFNFKLNIFGPLLPNKPDQTVEQKIQLVGGDLTKLIKQLSQILEQYITVDKIDLETMDVQFANTGIVDGASFESRILDQDVLNRIYDNIVTRFVTLVTPYLDKPEFALRFKLIRQSKDKHYATIPGRFITDNPFVELMEIPLENTKVKFTKYELEQGLNDGTPIAATSAEEKKSETPVEANPFAPQ